MDHKQRFARRSGMQDFERQQVIIHGWRTEETQSDLK